MEGKTQAPNHSSDGQQIGPIAHDHHQDCREGRAKATEIILWKGIRGRHPVRIIGRIGDQHQTNRQTHTGQYDPEDFLAPPLKRFLHIAV